jgi:serine/threonine-protein kinase RsbW
LSSRRFNVRREPFESVRLWLEAFCSEVNAAEQHVWQLQLVLEEFFVNSLKHGYPGLKDAPEEWPAWITLNIDNTGVQVVYEDAAVEFNPFAKIERPDYSGPVENWRVGGLGLPMVETMGRDLSYERVDGRNRLTLTLPASEE